MEQKQNKCLIFFHGLIATLSYFTEALKASAESIGLECLILDANDDPDGNRQRIIECASKKNCTAILFNNIMLEHLPSQEDIDGKLQLKVLNILVDHPITYPGALTFPLKDYHIVVIDRDYVRFIERYYPEVKNRHFMPLGGIKEENALPYDNREIDILYVANCQEQPAFIEIPEFADGGKSFYETVCGLLIDNTFLTTEDAILFWLKQNGMRLTKNEIVLLYYRYGYRCEQMVKRYFKHLILGACSQAGLRVEIYGGGWESLPRADQDHIHIHPPVSPKECGILSGQSKICFNIMPWFKNGSHDRIHTAMLNGALSVTDSSLYLSERFTHGKEIVFFDLKNIPELINRIREILDNPKYAGEIASCGYQIGKDHDTWSQRLSFLLSL